MPIHLLYVVELYVGAHDDKSVIAAFAARSCVAMFAFNHQSTRFTFYPARSSTYDVAAKKNTTD